MHKSTGDSEVPSLQNKTRAYFHSYSSINVTYFTSVLAVWQVVRAGTHPGRPTSGQAEVATTSVVYSTCSMFMSWSQFCI